jgi:endonuclease YncB( thermonuclease family)
MQCRLFLASFLCICFFAAPSAAMTPQHIYGRIVRVAEGDTLTVFGNEDLRYDVRLIGADAPNSGQAFSPQAKENLAKKVMGKFVDIEIVDRDQFGRNLGRVYLSKRFINLEQVRDGFAWRDPQFDKKREFVAAERDARAHRRGLWADRHPVAPWEYLREKARANAAK